MTFVATRMMKLLRNQHTDTVKEKNKTGVIRQAGSSENNIPCLSGYTISSTNRGDSHRGLSSQYPPQKIAIAVSDFL